MRGAPGTGLPGPHYQQNVVDALAERQVRSHQGLDSFQGARSAESAFSHGQLRYALIEDAGVGRMVRKGGQTAFVSCRRCSAGFGASHSTSEPNQSVVVNTAGEGAYRTHCHREGGKS